MKPDNVSLLIFSILGIAMGYLSLFIRSGKTSLLITLIVMIVIGKVLAKAYKKDTKWWLGNGGFLYLLLWFVFWIFFFNL